jgi:glycosyl transferase family 2
VTGELPTEPGVNDDFLIETALRELGLRVVYAAEAVTRMRVPTTVADFLHQRRRIHYGYMREERRSQKAKATQRPGAMARAALSLIKEQPWSIPALGLLVLLDTAGRLLARLDVMRGAGHAAWTPALTTKQAIDS